MIEYPNGEIKKGEWKNGQKTIQILTSLTSVGNSSL